MNPLFDSTRRCPSTLSAYNLQGNVILTDANYEIMTLLRSHRDDAKGLQIMARYPYPLHSIRLRTIVAAEQLTAALMAEDAPPKLRSERSSAHPPAQCATETFD